MSTGANTLKYKYSIKQHRALLTAVTAADYEPHEHPAGTEHGNQTVQEMVWPLVLDNVIPYKNSSLHIINNLLSRQVEYPLTAQVVMSRPSAVSLDTI